MRLQLIWSHCCDLKHGSFQCTTTRSSTLHARKKNGGDSKQRSSPPSTAATRRCRRNRFAPGSWRASTCCEDEQFHRCESTLRPPSRKRKWTPRMWPAIETFLPASLQFLPTPPFDLAFVVGSIRGQSRCRRALPIRA